MVYAQFESAQFKPSESGNASNTDSASVKMLLEAQSYKEKSYQVSDSTVSQARGTVGVAAGDNTGTKVVDKEVDKMISGFAIDGEKPGADKGAIACRMLKGQKIVYGRIISTEQEGDAKPNSETGRPGPTDQDRASRFELYLQSLCNRRK